MGQCTIDSIYVRFIGGCDSNGTDDNYMDDFFTGWVTVEFSNAPSLGELVIDGPKFLEERLVNITDSISPGDTSFVFKHVRMRADSVTYNINVTASFRDASGTLCIDSNLHSGYKLEDTVWVKRKSELQCTTCNIDGAHGTSYPDCWAPEGTGLPDCENSINYAPDPDAPEDTPLKYVRAIIHIFQKEDPNNLDMYLPDPGGVDNYSIADIDVIQSWFDLSTEGNANDFLANLCPDTTDGSPDMTDARFRILNNGEVGVDVFFHPDNKGWGMGYYDCDGQGGSGYGGLGTVRTKYLTGGSGDTLWKAGLPQWYIDTIKSDDLANAFHIFIARGSWVDVNSNGAVDTADCVNVFPGGFTSSASLNCTASGDPPPAPMQLSYGSYELYRKFLGDSSVVSVSIDSPEELSNGFLGELYHVLSLDHIGPLRAHHSHEGFADGCEDTEWESDFNVLGCNFSGDPGTKCALTQCQLGKVHYLFEALNPAIQRFPDGNGGFTTERNCVASEPDIVIEDGDDIVWNSGRSLRSNIVIEDGGRLTITCRVGFPEDATVTVEEGGKLHLLGGELHSNCNDRRWEGVVIEGNQFAGQWPPTSQGYMFSNQDAAIEQANTSIFVDGGGVAFITSTRFLNTGGAIMEQYDRPNFSRFLGCDFDMDGSEFDMGGGPFFHASLVGVRSVTFQNCTFNVGNVPDAQLEELRGVNALSSTFNVRNSTFNGLHNAIAANDGFLSPLTFFDVRGCTFDGNHTGIHTFGAEDFTVIDNTFLVGGAPFDGLGFEPMGMGMGNNSTGFRIEGNTFRRGSGSGSDDLMGILAEDCGTAANNIDGNAFYDLEIGNQAQGDNRGGLVGLQYWCNYNTLNDRDFLVANDGNGIAPSQGNGLAVRDTFSSKNVLSDEDFKNGVGNIVDFYHRDFPVEKPDSLLNIFPIQVLGTETNDCPWDRGGGGDEGLTSAEWQQVKTDFNTSRDNWRNERDTLLSLLDGGDTQDVLSDISSVNQSTVSQVTQDLLNLSPYLSIVAMQAVIAQDTVFSTTNLDDILSANPDGLRSAAMQALIRADLPQVLADSILVDAGNTTARTDQQNEVAQHRTEMHRLADILIRDIVKDTLGMDTTLLRTWLSNKENLEADYAVVGTFVSTENFAQAWVELDSIPLNYDLTAAEEAEHDHYEDLLSFWENLLGSGRTVMQLGPTHIDTLEAIADTSDAAAGAIAKGILNSLYGYNYQVVPLGTGGQQQSMVAPPSGGFSQLQGNASLISAFPNPADEQVKFSWRLPEGVEAGTIIVSDIQGRTVLEREVEGQRGMARWDTGHLEQGVYFFQLAHREGASETYKLVMIK